MQRTNLSLRWLEIFQLAAKSGSVQRVAVETGLSVSTVSHHLRSLQQTLGVELLDHSRRPMVLTPAGTVFLRYVEEGLRLIREGETELTSGNLSETRQLRLAIVDDFDSEIAPELAKFLARAMPRCTFIHHTRPSHEILEMLGEQRIDVGIATRPIHDVTNLIEMPLLRDPFLVALPVNFSMSPEELLAGRSTLPFLRYSRKQIIGALIEAHLRRSRISLPNRFEIESNPSVMGMVADGAGWAITTPSSYLRARRFHGKIALHRLPGKGFARTLSLFASDYSSQGATEMIANTLRRLIGRGLVEPVRQDFPWLASEFRVLD